MSGGGEHLKDEVDGRHDVYREAMLIMLRELDFKLYLLVLSPVSSRDSVLHH